MVRKTDSAGTWYYYWNAENQLVRVVKPGSGPLSYRTINYKYDALGRRVERQMKRGGTTSFTYDGQDVILDQKSDGSTTTYVNGPGIDNKLKQTSTTTGTLCYLQDHLGSTTALTDSSGNFSTSITYDSYGNSTPNALTRYGYTGRELDADTGLMYYRARWYDPQLGRFISEDAIGFSGGLNFYSYVDNDPDNFTDPLGQDGTGVSPNRKRRRPRGRRRIIDPPPIGSEPPPGTINPPGTPPSQPYAIPSLQCDCETAIPRLPDFFTGEVNVGFGPLVPFGWSGQVILDRQGNLYIEGLGFNFGKSATLISGALTMGWVNQRCTPRNKELIDVLSDQSVGAAGGYGGGIEFTGNKYGSTTRLGFMSPQVGASWGYTSHIGNLGFTY